RADIRTAITVAHDKLRCHLYTFDSSINIANCQKWGNRLIEINAKIGKDNQSSRYYDKIKELIDQLQSDAKPPPPAPTVPTPSPSVVKPIFTRDDEAKIPPFDGQPSNYRQFERLYEVKYGNNPSYDDADRFLILQNLIGPKGRELIRGLDPDSDGLKEAKKRLNEHFNDPYRIREDVRKKL